MYTEQMDRFWNKVKKTDNCWFWTAGTFDDGYGKFKFEKKNRKAHRISWLLTNGDIPEGMLVCHHCDNPLCVKPSHLFLGTPKDNTQDMIKKGRQHNIKKTHCKNGHEYSGANLKMTNKGYRQCRTCQNDSWNKMYQRKKSLKAGN